MSLHVTLQRNNNRNKDLSSRMHEALRSLIGSLCSSKTIREIALHQLCTVKSMSPRSGYLFRAGRVISCLLARFTLITSLPQLNCNHTNGSNWVIGHPPRAQYCQRWMNKLFRVWISVHHTCQTRTHRP